MMGITGTLLYLALGLCLFKSATSVLNCATPSSNRLVRYDLELIDGLFNDLDDLTPEERERYDALPPALMGDKSEELKMVNSLSSIIKQRELINNLGDSEIALVLRKIMDTLYNDTCKFLHSKFGMDCTNVQRTKRDLLLIETRLLTQSLKKENELSLPNVPVVFNYRYIQLDKALDSNCTEINTIVKVHGDELLGQLQPTVDFCKVKDCGISQ